MVKPNDSLNIIAVKNYLDSENSTFIFIYLFIVHTILKAKIIKKNLHDVCRKLWVKFLIIIVLLCSMQYIEIFTCLGFHLWGNAGNQLFPLSFLSVTVGNSYLSNWVMSLCIFSLKTSQSTFRTLKYSALKKLKNSAKPIESVHSALKLENSAISKVQKHKINFCTRI